MFNVPAWTNDVPKTDLNFGRKVTTKKKNKSEHSQNFIESSTKKRVKKKIKQKSKILINKASSSSLSSKSPIRKATKQRMHSNNQRPITIGRDIACYSDTANKVPVEHSGVQQDAIEELIANAKKKETQKQQAEKGFFRESKKIAKFVAVKEFKKEKKLQADKGTKVAKAKSKPLPFSVNKIKSKTSMVPQVSSHNIKVNIKKTEKKTISEHAKSKAELASEESGSTFDSKKEKIKKLLERNKSSTSVENKLRERMVARMKAAQFRYLNEKLYTSSSSEAKAFFMADPNAFLTYHQGYQQQVKKWPVNPLDIIISKIEKMPSTYVIADMGCGEAALSRRVVHDVRSFDLVALAPGVTVCDMAHTPLHDASVDVTVYCLALMGTELTEYLIEANRILKMGGHLLIAEVESRFEDINTFTRGVERLGFKLKSFDKERSVFFFMHFEKIGEPPTKKHKLPTLQLKPCLYKKR